MMFNEEAKAVQEVAKTGQESLKTAQMVGSFISRIIGGSLEQGVGIFEDKLKYMRLERAARLECTYRKLQEELNLKEPDKVIPMKYAVPLFQAATLEDDNYLQDLWVNLLIKASHAEFKFDVNRTYIDILERLSPFEARILLKIYSLNFEKSKSGVNTTELPQKVTIEVQPHLKNEDDIETYVFPAHFDFNDRLDESVLFALQNLDRLGCLSATPTMGPSKDYTIIAPTKLGKTFVGSCTFDIE